MKKLKISANLLAVVMLMALFMGWDYLLVAAIFIYGFCEAGTNLKNLVINVVAVFVGCFLFSTLWTVIYEGYELGLDGINGLFSLLISFGADMGEVTLNLNKYLLTPLGIVMSFLSSAVSFLIVFAKFKFAISVLTNRPMPKVFGKIQEYVNHVGNFIYSNSYEDNEANK